MPAEASGWSNQKEVLGPATPADIVRRFLHGFGPGPKQQRCASILLFNKNVFEGHPRNAITFSPINQRFSINPLTVEFVAG